MKSGVLAIAATPAQQNQALESVIARGPPLTDAAEALWRVPQESIRSLVLLIVLSFGSGQGNVNE